MHVTVVSHYSYHGLLLTPKFHIETRWNFLWTCWGSAFFSAGKFQSRELHSPINALSVQLPLIAASAVIIAHSDYQPASTQHETNTNSIIINIWTLEESFFNMVRLQNGAHWRYKICQRERRGTTLGHVILLEDEMRYSDQNFIFANTY